MPLAADRVTFDDDLALLILDPAILTDDVAREVWHRLPLLLRGERGRVKVTLFEVFAHRPKLSKTGYTMLPLVDASELRLSTLR